MSTTLVPSIFLRPDTRLLVARRLPVVWGVTDAGLSSLATFVAGIFASRYLDPATLGAYALVFSASVVAAIIPTQLFFVPGETAAIALPDDTRLLAMRRTLLLGGGTNVVAALAVSLAWLIIPGTIPAAAVAALVITGCACALVSPIQDHVRRMLHLSGRSGVAALLSWIHAVVVIGTIAVAMSIEVAPEWIPFGALGAGNIVSLLVGVAMSRLDDSREAPAFTAAQLAVAGRWLLVVGLLAPGTAFLVATIVAHVSGPATLGYSEACRQVAQPLLVFATGLSTVIGPRLTAAAQERSSTRARRSTRTFFVLMATVGVPYLLIAGRAGWWNPLATLLPNAYAIPGLVLATLAANVLNGLNFSQRAELLGAGEARTLARVEVGGNVLRIGVAAMAGALQSFAIPVGLIVLGVVRVIGYTRNLKRHYGGERA